MCDACKVETDEKGKIKAVITHGSRRFEVGQKVRANALAPYHPRKTGKVVRLFKPDSHVRHAIISVAFSGRKGQDLRPVKMKPKDLYDIPVSPE